MTLSVLVQKVDLLPLHTCFNGSYEIAANKDLVVGDTHNFFNKYPTRYIPHIPKWAISKYLDGSKDGILDPFSGSGTTMVEAVIAGKQAYAIEIDPFGRMLSLVRSTPLSQKQITTIEKIAKNIKHHVQSNFTEDLWIPHISNISLWFSKKAIHDLSQIHFLIKNNSNSDAMINNFFFVAFGSVIRKASNAENGSPKPYVSKRFPKAPVDVNQLFSKRLDQYIDRMKQFSSLHYGRLGRAYLIGEDARRIDTYSFPGPINLIMTSPPYLNAFDYVRALKLENLWLGLADEDTLRQIRTCYIGRESVGRENGEKPRHWHIQLNLALLEIYKKDPKRAWVVYRYFEEMEPIFKQLYNLLPKNGVFCLVVGENSIRDIKITTPSFLIDIAQNIGFRLETLFRYIIRDRYLHIPRNGKGGLISKDWVIVLRK